MMERLQNYNGESPLKILFMRSGGYFMDIDPPDAPMIAPPKGILYLAGMFKDDDTVQTSFLDVLANPDLLQIRKEYRNPPIYFGMSDGDIVGAINDANPHIIAITSTANYYINDTIKLITVIRRNFPSVFIVAGGPDATNDYNVYFDRAAGLDAIIMKEGEASFKNLVRALQKGKPWKHIRGIAYLESGKIIINPDQPYIADLDELRCDYDIVDLEHYFRLNKEGFPSRLILPYPGSHRSIDIITSRGCSHRCSFCCIHLHMGKKFRAHSPAHVLAEMELLVERHGVRNIHFEDDNLLHDPGRFKEILRGIISRGWNITWDTPNGVRADLVDEELLRLCRESGCSYLVFGAESGSKKVLDTIIKKDISLDQLARACALCYEHEIDTLAFYIFGLPGETKEDLLKTYYFAFDLFKKYNTTPIFQLWRPYRNTESEMKVRGRYNITEPVVSALHEEHRIPYTLFYSKVYEDEEITMNFLSYYFRKYLKDAAKYAFFNWVKITRRRPLLFVRFFFQILYVVLRAYLVPSRGRSKLKEYMIGPAILPFAQVRGLGRRRMKRTRA